MFGRGRKHDSNQAAREATRAALARAAMMMQDKDTIADIVEPFGIDESVLSDFLTDCITESLATMQVRVMTGHLPPHGVSSAIMVHGVALGIAIGWSANAEFEARAEAGRRAA